MSLFVHVPQVCGVGVAHGARIGGIRMLDGDINDRLEGLSLQHALDKYAKSCGESTTVLLQHGDHLAQGDFIKSYL